MWGQFWGLGSPKPLREGNEGTGAIFDRFPIVGPPDSGTVLSEAAHSSAFSVNHMVPDPFLSLYFSVMPRPEVGQQKRDRDMSK